MPGKRWGHGPRLALLVLFVWLVPGAIVGGPAADSDGVLDGRDKSPLVANPGQAGRTPLAGSGTTLAEQFYDTGVSGVVLREVAADLSDVRESETSSGGRFPKRG